jgi:hypothetical protein
MNYKQIIPKKSILNKFTRLVIFLFFFFLIFKAIDQILLFYNLKQEIAHIYFNWISLLFFLFVLLPIRKSVL